MLLDEEDSYEEVAFLACRTTLRGFQFVSALNKCAHLNLHRIDLSEDESDMLSMSLDAPSETALRLPIYSYRDDSAGITYRVVDAWYYPNMPEALSTALQGCDKVIVFYGMSAYEQQMMFYERLRQTRPIDPESDPAQQNDEAAWNALSNEIIDLNYFDYSDREFPKSSQWQASVEAYSPRLRKMAATIERFFADIVYMIDECEDSRTQYRRLSNASS